MFLNNNNKFNISISGMMGSGKSTISKIIAKKINYKFVDIDKLIEEKEKKTINKIFEEKGEKYFRKLEEKITIDVLNKKKIVVSLGGGAIINKNIRKSIIENSYNIYLKVDIDILVKRLKNSKNRPLIYEKDLSRVLAELIKKREKFYNNADLIIENEKNINNTVERIINYIKHA
jgi:shikimate kinase